MNRKRCSEFENVAEIIKKLNLTYDNDTETKKQELMSTWKSVVGEKLAQYSSPKEITDEGVMIIGCKNSVVANELFNSRININKIFKEKAIFLKLGFKYIKITYNR